MKKAFLVLAFLIGLASITETYAQPGAKNLLSVYGNTTDTVANSATKYLYIPAQIRGMVPEVTMVINVEKLSGTVGGTITIEAQTPQSGDAVSTKWYSYYKGIVPDSTITGVYTFTPTDVTNQSFRFKLSNFRESWVRIKYVGTGTMGAKISGVLLY